MNPAGMMNYISSTRSTKAQLLRELADLHQAAIAMEQTLVEHVENTMDHMGAHRARGHVECLLTQIKLIKDEFVD
jgi:hypothetical protein